MTLIGFAVDGQPGQTIWINPDQVGFVVSLSPSTRPRTELIIQGRQVVVPYEVREVCAALGSFDGTLVPTKKEKPQ